MLILPYIGQEELYREFRLDEPWDSEHNIRLLERMPSTYEAGWTRYVDVPPYHTVCQVFVGPGTPFEGGCVIGMSRGFPDSTSNTLLCVEAGEPVPWTKPADIPYYTGQPIHPRGLFREGFRACMADGGVTFLRHDIDQDELHALITRNGGEEVHP